jgi:hypothetical protein
MKRVSRSHILVTSLLNTNVYVVKPQCMIPYFVILNKSVIFRLFFFNVVSKNLIGHIRYYFLIDRSKKDKVFPIATRITTTFLKIQISNLLDANYKAKIFAFRLVSTQASVWKLYRFSSQIPEKHFSGIHNWFYVRWCMI